MTRNDIINGLEHCAVQAVDRDCDSCPVGFGEACALNLKRAALELLKSQEPRVMTWEEAQANVNQGPFIIMEVRDSTGTEIDFGVLVDDSYEMSEGSLLTVSDFWMLEDDYGKRFRCWTSRPTDEQREATQWQ